MQKACGIIAISAIALSASQFASAQTSSPDRSARTADQSSAAREEVKSTLRDAGFTNIRIMSESFLVHAIDQNGDPVVMVVRPDSRAIMPEASEGQDEANAPEPGYPDSLTDLSEDEDEATAPTPLGGRIGKSSKMTDRPPYPGDEERADAGQNAGQNTGQGADQDTAKSGKMTGRQQNSGAAEQAEANQTASQSAKMHDGQPEQGAGNEKVPGRPSGMMTEMKEGEQGALNLSTAQRAEIWKRLGSQQATNALPGFEPKVGATVPASLQLKSLPNSVSRQVPQVQSYNYAMVQNELLIVDPATKKIVTIITE